MIVQHTYILFAFIIIHNFHTIQTDADEPEKKTVAQDTAVFFSHKSLVLFRRRSCVYLPMTGVK